MIINDVYFNCELIDIIQELISQLRANGIDYIQKYKEGPTDVQVCCPYHKNGQERQPSAGIRKYDGIFHCFACGQTRTLQQVISYCFGHDDLIGKFGWEWLLKNFKSVSVEERNEIRLDYFRNSSDSRSANRKTNNEYITEEELDRYRYIHPYMYERRLTDDIIEMFDLGYDASTESITFPVKDINGNCLFVARRSVNSKFFNYPAGVEKPLYGLYEFTEYANSNEVIVCESMIDALTAWGYSRPAVALNGLGNELAIKQLNELSCRKVILATDNDDAGRQARKKLRSVIKNKIITEFDYASYPAHAKDINDMSREEFENLSEIF